MDEETIRSIVISILAAAGTVLAGNGLWTYATERLKRTRPTQDELVEQDLKQGRFSLELAETLRKDLDDLRREMKEERKACHEEIEALRLDNKTKLDELDEMYQRRIAELRAEYEDRLRQSDEEIKALREKIHVLEEERKILLGLRDTFEKAKKAGTISGD